VRTLSAAGCHATLLAMAVEPTTEGAPTPAPRPSLRPVGGAFLIFGSFTGAWAVAVIDIQRTFDISDAELGLVLALGILLAAAVNAVGGALTDRWGAGTALARALVIWAALLVGVAASPALGMFAVAFTLATAAGGFVDVVMNVVSAAALADRPGHLVRFHGLFNGGAVLGAIATGAALEVGASWRVVWVAIAVGGFAVAYMSHSTRLPSPPKGVHPSLLRALASLRHEGLVILAVVFAASAMVEGGVATWGVLYLRGHLDVGVVAGVGSYVVGQGLATITRIAGGPSIGAFGTRRGIAIGAGITAFGIATEALTSVPALGVIGLALASVGITVVWPLLLADVNNEARHPALAIGGVTAAGYLGMVAGPPIVGILSGLFNLTIGLLVLAATALFVAVTPAHVRPGSPATDP
jgi:Major Facilitator Superfamily